MKYRRDTQKVEDVSVPKEVGVEWFISEVVDIHRVAFDEAKKFFDEHFEDVHDFDSLKAKVEKIIAGFIPEIESKIQELSLQWEEKKKMALNLIEKAYGERQAFLQNAQVQAERFVGAGSEVLQNWIAEVTKKLDTSYEKLKNETEEEKPQA